MEYTAARYCIAYTTFGSRPGVRTFGIANTRFPRGEFVVEARMQSLLSISTSLLENAIGLTRII